MMQMMNVHVTDPAGKGQDEAQKPFDLETRDAAYDYGWSHDVFTRTNTPDRVATKLAQQFLPMIEKALKTRGVEAKVGVEIECAAHILDVHGTVSDHQRLFHQLLVHKKRGHSYLSDVEDDDGLLEFSTKPLSLGQVPYVVRNIKRELIKKAEFDEHGESGHKKYPTRFSRHVTMNKPDAFSVKPLSQGWGGNDVNRPVIVGEHVNVSLHDMEAYVTESNLMVERAWKRLSSFAVSRICAQDYALLAGHHTSMQRVDRMVRNNDGDAAYNYTAGELEDIETNTHVVQLNGAFDQDARIEFRYPDTAQNPFLSMLAVGVSSLACVDAVKTLAGNVSLSDVKNDKLFAAFDHLRDHCHLQASFPADASEALNRFKAHSNVVTMLHQIVDEQVPDEAENAKLHKDVEQFEKAVIARTEQLIERDSQSRG